MARGINKVILIGNLGADPEVRYTPNGSAIANVSIATTDSWKDKQTGEKQERTEWHRVVFFNRLAEIVGEYLRKGSKAYIEGSLRTRKWQDKSGIDRYTTEIIANEMQMLDNRSFSADQQPYQQQAYDQQQPNYNQTHAASTAGNKQSQPATAPATTADDFDDDIPF